MSEDPLPPKPDWEHVKWLGAKEEEKPDTRTSWWMGLAAFVILAGMVAGVVCTFGPYLLAWQWDHPDGRHYHTYSSTPRMFERLVEDDTAWAMKLRFWVGAAAGAASAAGCWLYMSSKGESDESDEH